MGWEPEPEGALGISGAHRKEYQDSQPLTLEPAYAIFVLFFPACLYLRCTLVSLNLPETLDNQKELDFYHLSVMNVKSQRQLQEEGEAQTRVLASHFAYCCRQTSLCFLRLWNEEWSGTFLKAVRETLGFHIMKNFC